MKNSDIFNEYAKIALEKSLISEAKEDAKSILEKTRRADSQSISDIAALYGIKPDQIKEYEYEKNIAEVAHPNAAVVSPSHDKLNGLVENINERQNILLNIVNKPVNGLNLYHKYAEEELIKSLIRTANHMDNLNQEDLRVLADDCIYGLKKKADDETLQHVTDLFSEYGTDVVDVAPSAVIGGLGVGILSFCLGGPFAIAAGAGALALGGLSAIFKTGPTAENVSVNSQATINQIEKLVQGLEGKVGKIGNLESKITFLNNYLKELKELKELAEKYSNMIDSAQMENNKFKTHIASQISSNRNKTLHHLKRKNRTLTSEHSQFSNELSDDYLNKLTSMSDPKTGIIKTFLQNVERKSYSIPESSAFMQRLQKVINPLVGIFGDTVHDAQRASESLLRVISSAKIEIEHNKLSVQKNYSETERKVENIQQQNQEQEGDAPEPVDSRPTSRPDVAVLPSSNESPEQFQNALAREVDKISRLKGQLL